MARLKSERRMLMNSLGKREKSEQLKATLSYTTIDKLRAKRKRERINRKKNRTRK